MRTSAKLQPKRGSKNERSDARSGCAEPGNAAAVSLEGSADGVAAKALRRMLPDSRSSSSHAAHARASTGERTAITSAAARSASASNGSPGWLTGSLNKTREDVCVAKRIQKG